MMHFCPTVFLSDKTLDKEQDQGTRKVNRFMISHALEVLGPPVLIRERAFDEVRDAIISGRIAPGTRLIERELCEALKISRASVREVLRRLEAERLISAEPRRGPVVMVLSLEEAGEIYEIRAMLEGLVIRRFTELASDDEIATLESIFARVRQAAAETAIQAIVSLMRDFNAHAIAVARHGVAGDLLMQLDARISWLRVKAMAVPGRLESSLDEMSTVLRHVRDRSPDRAATAIRQSVMNAREAALLQLAADNTPCT
jgi:GntR family transcriptional regulator, trigonelline degradation regulator